MQHATFKALHPPDVVSRTKANLCMQLHLAIVVDVISLGPLHTVIFVVKQSECPDTVSYQHCLERVDLQQGNIKPTSECRTKKVTLSTLLLIKRASQSCTERTSAAPKRGLAFLEYGGRECRWKKMQEMTRLLRCPVRQVFTNL